jgi:hypothetical protein
MRGSEVLFRVKDAVEKASGRTPHAATIHRWVKRGVRGIKLETVILGGLRFTSVEAVHRFMDRTTEAYDGKAE